MGAGGDKGGGDSSDWILPVEENTSFDKELFWVSNPEHPWSTVKKPSAMSTNFKSAFIIHPLLNSVCAKCTKDPKDEFAPIIFSI